MLGHSHQRDSTLRGSLCFLEGAKSLKGSFLSNVEVRRGFLTIMEAKVPCPLP